MEREAGGSRKKKVIGIVGASGGAGATFIATSLAVAMAALGAGTAFLQTHLCGCRECLSRPLPYYELGLDNAFLPGRFADLFALKHAGGRTDNRANLYRGVNWAVRRPASPPVLLEPGDIAGDYVIWDEPPLFTGAGGGQTPLFTGAGGDGGVSGADFDLLLLVLRPERAHMMAGLDTLRICLSRWGGICRLVFNMTADRAALRQAEHLAGRKGDFYIAKEPAQADEDIRHLAAYLVTLF